MKTSKLMIEDWVHVNVRRTPISVTHDFNGRVTLIDDLNSQIGVGNKWAFDYDEVEPIPLIPEILERNGFCDTYKDRSLAKDNVFKWYDLYGYCVTVDMNANAIKIQHDSRVLLDLRYNIVVPVHELQHALRLCGIDKEITL